MSTEQQQFIEENRKAVERAKKTGKLTRLGAGQYYLYANETLFFLEKKLHIAFSRGGGWRGGESSYKWTWRPDYALQATDYFDTLSEAKSALYKHVESKQKR